MSTPEVDQWRTHTPVLVDDIISTAHTMAKTITRLRNAGLQAPVCVGVHGVFAHGAEEALRAAGAARIVTCNTIEHPTNAIDLSSRLTGAVKDLLLELADAGPTWENDDKNHEHSGKARGPAFH